MFYLESDFSGLEVGKSKEYDGGALFAWERKSVFIPGAEGIRLLAGPDRGTKEVGGWICGADGGGWNAPGCGGGWITEDEDEDLYGEGTCGIGILQPPYMSGGWGG